MNENQVNSSTGAETTVASEVISSVDASPKIDSDTTSTEVSLVSQCEEQLTKINQIDDIQRFANKIFDDAILTPTEKASLLAKSKGKLGAMLDALTSQLQARNNMPGLNSRDVTRIDTERHSKLYKLTSDESFFINQYDYTRGTLDTLSRRLSSSSTLQ